MKKAVIQTGGKQYLVSEGETLEVELLKEGKEVNFNPLLLINDKKVYVGAPTLEKSKVSAEIIEETKDDKITAIRYKAKKRVKKIRGHRQKHSKIKITRIE